MSTCPSHDITICELQQMINSRSPDISWLRKFFLNLARIHFSDSKHYAHLESLIGSMVWRGDDTSTLSVDIGEQMGPSVQTVSLPGVYVNIGKFQFSGQVNDDLEHIDVSGQSQIHTAKASSMAQFVCLHRASDASANMASTLAGYLMGIKPLMQTCGFFGYQMESIDGPTLVKINKEDNYQTLIMVSFNFNQRVTINTGGHMLRRISLDLQNEIA